jgi:TRAP-type C4-dicarboxylate transport system permease large subunit
VVLIATLNNQVTTDELFTNGLLVFALTATLLLIAMFRKISSFEIASVADALPQTQKALWGIVPYISVAVGVFLVYGLVLDTWINEHTAPLVLPGILLSVVAFERLYLRPTLVDESDQESLWSALASATQESSTHIGALLMVMAASVGLGGVVERGEVMNLFPQDFGSPQLAMLALVFIMVIVGMLMDALGAVVLVSVTLAGVAYKNGIDPVHFWMVVLVAFELGYLTPPVAINHLLARQVIGEEAEVEDDGTEGFYNKHEHLILPMMVMGTALILVAFVPFFFYSS